MNATRIVAPNGSPRKYREAHIGEPGGWPKPQTVDLAGLFKGDDYSVRITTNTAMHYDRATVIDYDPGLEMRVTEMDPDRAELVKAGFASTFRPDGRKPDLFNHENMMPYSPWAMACFGKHTRYGDVRPLLLEIDDMYAIMAPGDEVVIDFEAAKAPDLPEGWVRDFIFYADKKPEGLLETTADQTGSMPGTEANRTDLRGHFVVSNQEPRTPSVPQRA